MISIARPLLIATVIAAALSPGAPALAADAAKGAELVQAHCNMCHSPEAGQGPALDGVVGRKAGTAAGYAASAALKGSGLTWTPANLGAFLADPAKLVPGTTMPNPFVGPADRGDIIAYLATLNP
jgi:cytochrome c